MRQPMLLIPVVMLAGFGLVASIAGCEQIAQALGQDAGTSTATTTSTDASLGTDASVVGGACGAESNTGIQLCAATTLCPSVVVDTAAMPNCGFRIRGSVVDLVCGCNTFVCPVGTFTTCDEAAALLANETEALVCAQISNNYCTEVTAPTTTTTNTSSSSTSSSNGGTGCDRACVTSCGGGASCAALCNCD